MPIENVDDLRDHLQTAIIVEILVFPPYLYAMYSLADQASDAAKLIKSIAAEEMLHATLLANILLGIGGEPRFYDPEVIPSYPTPLLHHKPELILTLEPYSRALVERAFLAIERPGKPGAPAQVDEFESLGQFYSGLHEATVAVAANEDIFANPQVERQLHDPHGYLVPRFDSASSGGLVVVDSMAGADAVFDIVLHQGEGLSSDRYADPDHAELTHYAKFQLLDHEETGRSGVLPVVFNPTLETLPSDVQPVAEFTNAVYSYLYVIMDRIFAPHTEDRHHQLGLLYGAMIALLGPLSRYLMTMPVDDTHVAGPPYQYYRFADPANAEAELRKLATPLFGDHPKLQPVLRQLDRLPK